MLAVWFLVMAWDFAIAIFVIGLIFGVIDVSGVVDPTTLAIIILLLRFNQILTYIARNSDDIKELLIEDEDNMEEIMYHPPYEVEE